MKLGITSVFFSPRVMRRVSVARGLARYATDVTTTAATYGEAQITMNAIALTFDALADAIAEQKIGGLIAEALAGQP